MQKRSTVWKLQLLQMLDIFFWQWHCLYLKASPFFKKVKKYCRFYLVNATVFSPFLTLKADCFATHMSTLPIFYVAMNWCTNFIYFRHFITFYDNMHSYWNIILLFASYLFLIIIKYNGHGAPDQKKALNNKAGRGK